MADIRNSELLNNIRKITGDDLTISKIPSELAEKVLPVIDLTPLGTKVSNVWRDGTLIMTGSLLLYTCPANRDFFLTNLWLNLSTMVGGDNLEGYLQFTDEEGSVRKFVISNMSSIAGSIDSNSLNLVFPLKLKRDSQINLILAAGAAVGNLFGGIVGFDCSVGQASR